MMIDTCLLAVVLFRLWQWTEMAASRLLALFFLVDGAYLAANLTKVPDGGWFPLLVGLHRLHLPHHLGEGPPADDRPA